MLAKDFTSPRDKPDPMMVKPQTTAVMSEQGKSKETSNSAEPATPTKHNRQEEPATLTRRCPQHERKPPKRLIEQM